MYTSFGFNGLYNSPPLIFLDPLVASSGFKPLSDVRKDIYPESLEELAKSLNNYPSLLKDLQVIYCSV